MAKPTAQTVQAELVQLKKENTKEHHALENKVNDNKNKHSNDWYIRNYINGFIYMGINYFSRITNIGSYVTTRNIRYG